MSESNSGTTTDRKDIDIVSKLRTLIRDELRGLYTSSMCVVESVDTDNRRVTVSLKVEENVTIDNIPIASPYATDGFGMVTPVESGDEGVLFHTRTPIANQLLSEGHVDIDSDRRFQLDSGVFMPMVWLDPFTVPNHEQGQFVLSLDDGNESESTRFVMDGPDGTISFEAMEAGSAKASMTLNPDGSTEVTHTDTGNTITMNPDGTVTLGDSASAAALLNEEAVIQYEDTGDTGDGSASPTTKTATITDPGTDDTEAS